MHPLAHATHPPGMAEGYWEYRLKPWDMAAGVLIVEEAGGTVTTMDGRAFSGAGRGFGACPATPPRARTSRQSN